MASIQQIRLVLQGMPKWRGQSEAHEQIIWRAAARCTHYDSVAETVEKLGAEGQLEPFAAYRDMFAEIFSEEAIQDNLATRELVVNRMIQLGLPNTAQGMGLAVAELLHEGTITHTAQRLAQLAEAKRLQDEREHQAREIDRMVAEIVAYMLDPSGKPKFEYQREYKQKIAGLRALPFDQLEARYRYVMEQRAQRKTPVETLRDVVKIDAARQRQALYQRYEPIPDLYFPPGKSEGLSWSFQLFRRLPSTEQRRLLDHFGHQQIDDACMASGRN
jgi:hypothetical protein